MVLRQGLRLGGVGVAVGPVGSFFACRPVTSTVFVVSFNRFDPLIFVVLPLLLLMITVLATWEPARRASLVDPMRTLRDE
jgi:putative ABC transport system permease protein